MAKRQGRKRQGRKTFPAALPPPPKKTETKEPNVLSKEPCIQNKEIIIYTNHKIYIYKK